mmetsp:Transcript_8278/g.12740  ORF Transcript_8278/g.12740 Transcript_8278/m.12740 type:complete len:447 (+) Transcript_8278:23-1363(+)
MVSMVSPVSSSTTLAHATFLSVLLLFGEITISNGFMIKRATLSTSDSSQPASNGRHSGCFFYQQLQFSHGYDTCNQPTLKRLQPQQGKCLAASMENGEENTSLEGQEPSSRSSNNYQAAVLVLCTVPLAWGTFEPAVRLIYQQQDANGQVPALFFSLAYYFVASITLATIAIFQQSRMTMNEEGESNIIDIYQSKISSSSFKTTMKGGFELGTYLFLGNGLQVWGLATIPSDRAAFLLQLTTLFVPLFSSPLEIPLRTWMACAIALLGVLGISMDGSNVGDSLLASDTSSLFFLTQGDFFIVLAAVTYTLHCIRLEHYAKQMTSAVELGLFKAITELSLTAVALVVTTQMHSQSTIELLISTANGLPVTTVLAIVWIGVITIAYTIVAQSYGQARVIPTEANLIYTIQPVFTALVAWALLGENLGTAGYVGGSLIGVAVYLVVMDK